MTMPARRMRAGRRLAAASGGTAAVEFALISVPLLLLVFGIIEFGRLMWTREALQQTAIAAARCIGMTQSACGTAGVYNATMAATFIQAQAATWSIPLTASNVTVNVAATCGNVAGFSAVALTYKFNSVAPALIKALAGGTTLTANACFPNHP